MATKMIPGLPNYKKILLEKKPKKSGLSAIKATNANILFLFENGYPIQARPATGRVKKALFITQTMYPGFTVSYYSKPYTVVGWGYKSAEKLMVRLALAGHKVYNY
jgi:hypothetical protein